MVYFTLPSQKNIDRSPVNASPPPSTDPESTTLQVNSDEKDQQLTLKSRTSSLQSLASVASSVRSTGSSKHEQQNLRRAIMDVHGQGENDLSFKMDAIIYEVRPKNTKGLCYGILDDSTQGWYPHEAVEPIYFSEQHEVLKL